MKAYLNVLIFLGALVLSHPTGAASSNRCDDFLRDRPSPTYKNLRKDLLSEFGNLRLGKPFYTRLDAIINGDEPITDSLREEFDGLLSRIGYIHAEQWYEASRVLERGVSLDQATALKLARSMARTEPGKDDELLGFAGNYTEEQIRRKDRVLDLAGFTMDERLVLFNHKLVEEVLTRYEAENLFSDQTTVVSGTTAKKMNEEVIREANLIPVKPLNSPRKQGLDRNEATKLYELVTRNPIARLLHVRKYDPEGDIGFCFGRKFVAYLEALSTMGVDKESIRNVFVVGRMKSVIGKTIWDYHTALMVRSSEGGWWVIDPATGRLHTLEEWYRRMEAHAIDDNFRMYVTEASRMGASSSDHYKKAELFSAQYNNYFVDVLKYFQLKSKNQLEKKPLWTAVMDFVLKILRIGI